MTTSSSFGAVGARQWAGEGWQLARTRSGSGQVVIGADFSTRNLYEVSCGPIETSEPPTPCVTEVIYNLSIIIIFIGVYLSPYKMRAYARGYIGLPLKD
jgi:hypothetical protein